MKNLKIVCTSQNWPNYLMKRTSNNIFICINNFTPIELHTCMKCVLVN